MVPLRNVLERRPQRLPALYGGTTEITEGSILLFLVLACSIPAHGGRLGPKCLAWTAMPFTPCDVPASEKFSYSLSMLSHSSELLTLAWILSDIGTVISPVKAGFCRQSAAFSFFNLRKRDRMPTSVNIRISSTSFVKVFTAYGSTICFGGFCLPPVTPYMSCPKELTSHRSR